eukprot:3267756-Rhodomonas_salina.2
MSFALMILVASFCASSGPADAVLKPSLRQRAAASATWPGQVSADPSSSEPPIRSQSSADA